MEAIKLKGVSKDGSLTIAVPEEFDNKELEIILLTDETEESEYAEKKTEKLLSIIGKAKNPEFPITKYDAYNQ